jgi:hypothetical protein
MSWLSSFLGGGKPKLPKVKPAEEFEMDDYGFGIDAYLRSLERKSGFEDTIITGRKKPKLAAGSFLGAI